MNGYIFSINVKYLKYNCILLFKYFLIQPENELKLWLEYNQKH